MTREEKSQVIQDLTAKLADTNTVYLADISGLDALTTSDLRRACFKADVKISVVKNTLLAKAMEASDKDFGELQYVLKGNTSMMIAEAANAPAKVIKEFRKDMNWFDDPNRFKHIPKPSDLAETVIQWMLR